MSKQQIWLNGELLPQNSAQEIARKTALDRGLQYGDGFFTTILVRNQQLLNWQFHWQRIINSCQALSFAQFDQQALLSQLNQALQQTEMTAEFLSLKLIISRGAGAGYAVPANFQPNIWLQISAAPWQPTATNITTIPQISAKICQTPASINPALAGIKHLNRLDNVLARSEVQQAGFDEGLMFANQQLIGGTQTNILLLTERTIYTPDLSQAGVAGTCLASLQAIAAQFGLEWRLANLTLAELKSAQALICCNALRGLQQIQHLETPAETLNYQPNQLASELNQAWWQAVLAEPTKQKL